MYAALRSISIICLIYGQLQMCTMTTCRCPDDMARRPFHAYRSFWLPALCIVLKERSLPCQCRSVASCVLGTKRQPSAASHSKRHGGTADRTPKLATAEQNLSTSSVRSPHGSYVFSGLNTRKYFCHQICSISSQRRGL